jgi:hypothetical protein
MPVGSGPLGASITGVTAMRRGELHKVQTASAQKPGGKFSWPGKNSRSLCETEREM